MKTRAQLALEAKLASAALKSKAQQDFETENGFEWQGMGNDRAKLYVNSKKVRGDAWKAVYFGGIIA